MNMVSSIIFSSEAATAPRSEGIGMGIVRTWRGVAARGRRVARARAQHVAPARAQHVALARGRRLTLARARRDAWAVAAAGLSFPVLMATGCTTTVSANPVARPGGERIIDVVAAENFWGSLVSQLGGRHVRVLSLVSDPNADPHDYESSAQAARAVAGARYVVQNGAGYDSWMTKLLAANPATGRRVYDVGAALGKRPGDNPHLWYDPAYVTAACDHIEADLKALDPKDAGYFAARRAAVAAAFAGIREQLGRIRRDDAGKPVAATESIFAYLAAYLGLKLVSPPAFMDAVAEGNDPPASSVVLFERQLSARQAAVLVYNKQTATALTTSVRAIAAAHHIPVVGVTETIQPPEQSFEQWFGAELTALSGALNGGAR
jgi:zinc/manganese transport system substrate-binding protein